MEIILQDTPAAASRIAARYVAQKIRENPGCVLGLATGSTPLLLYSELIRLYDAGEIDFADVQTFNLDEYVGLAGDHPASYRHFMDENLFRRINIPREKTHVPDGLAKDIPRSCEEYEWAIAEAGGIEVQILGIGSDGHIGFNEPSSSLRSRTRIKTLTENTIRDNARFFDSPDEVPRHCITMGVGTIMESREVVLLAFGEHKARAIAEAFEGPVSAMNPASVLQLHPVVKVFLDEGAARELKRKEYYRFVFENKPEWQRF